MPKYRITAPDGNTYEVNAPDGASQDDVLAYVKQNYQGAQGQASASPQSADDLATAFYQAQAAGDEGAKQAIFHQLRQQGGTLRAPTQAEIDASKNTVASPLGTNAENFAAGAGKSVVDNFHGAQQIGAKLASFLPFVGDSAQAKYDQLKSDQTQTNQQDAPLMASKAGLFGNIAGQVGQAVVGGSAIKAAGLAGALGSGYGATAASGALQGAIQPLSGNQGEGSRLLNAGLGAGAGVVGRGLAQGIGSLVRSGAQSVAGALLPKASPEMAQLASSAIKDYGIPLKASQVAPSRVAKILDSVSGEVPFSGARQFGQAQQGAFNRAIAQTIGEDADNVTSNVFGRAAQRIGQGYDDIASRNAATLTPEVQQGLQGILGDATDLGGDESQRLVSGLLGRISKQAQDGVLPGNAYQSIISQINKASTAGGEKAYYAGQVKDVLKDAMQQSLSGEDQAAWQSLNQQYRNLKTIEPLVAKDAYSGNISPSQLIGRVGATKSGKAALAKGNAGDLGTLAAIGQNFVKDAVPNSGTAGRAIGFGLLGGAGYAHPLSAAASVVGSRGYQALMQSPQVLAKILQDPSIDQATKSVILQRLSLSSGLLGQQVALAQSRAQSGQSGYVPAPLLASP